MMNLSESIYDWGVEATRWVLPHTPFLPEKARRSIRGRLGLLERIERWSAHHRQAGPLVWFHAPSVGEGLQTRPVIEALRMLRPELQVFYTYYSPSAEHFAGELPVDHADYMPFDVVADVMQVMEAVRPEVLVFGKLDVWPNVTRVASWRDVPLALVSATVAPSSGRLRWPARRVLAEAYGRLDAVGAISVDDATRLSRLGVASERIEVTGDARFDQVWARAQAVDHTREPVSLLAGHEGPSLVAGSTWPEDEAHLVPALARLRKRHPELRFILVPHEPTAQHLARLEEALRSRELSTVRLSEVERGGAGAGERGGGIVVDRVGVLGELYALADIAYVGGGFGRRGLHSVLEPAALGAPVIFGPRHSNAREAGELVAWGGAVEISGRRPLEALLAEWLEDPPGRKAVGAAALDYVKQNLGAGQRNAELVLKLMGST